MSSTNRSPILLRDVGPALTGLALAAAMLVFSQDTIAVGSSTSWIFEFDEAKWLGGLCAGLLWAVLVAAGGVRVTSVHWRTADSLVTLAVAWVALSALWSPDPQAALLSLRYLLAIGTLLVLARVTAPSDLSIVILVAVSAALFGAVAITILSPAADSVLSGFGNANFRAESLLALTVLIAAIMVQPNASRASRVVAASAIVVGSAYLLTEQSVVHVFGLAAAAIWFAFHRWRRARLGIAVIVASAVLATIFTVLVVGVPSPPLDSDMGLVVVDDSSMSSAYERLRLWTNALAAFTDAPLFGHGIGSFDFVYPRYLERYADIFPSLGISAVGDVRFSQSYAHNEPIQALMDFGLIGALLIAAAVFWTSYCLVRQVGSSLSLQLYAACFAAIAGIALLEFPLQNPPTAFIAAIVIGSLLAQLAAASPGRGMISPGRLRIVSALLAAGLVLSVLPQQRELSSAMAFRNVEVLHDAEEYAEAFLGLQRTLENAPQSARIRGRAFPQLMSAGASYWSDSFDLEEVEAFYQVSRGAMPNHPVLLDMRLKYLLAIGLSPESLAEAEKLLDVFRDNGARRLTNVHIIDSAIGVQTGDKARARSGIERAKRFPYDKNEAERQNIELLEAMIGRM